MTMVVELRELFNNALMNLRTISIVWKFYLFPPNLFSANVTLLAGVGN